MYSTYIIGMREKEIDGTRSIHGGNENKNKKALGRNYQVNRLSV
jgi:hypothetical protein